MCNSDPQSASDIWHFKPVRRDEEQTRSLDTIKEEIQECQTNYECSFLKIGELLVEAKAIFGKRGEWLTWLKENVDISITTAQCLMKVYQVFSQKSIDASLGFTKLYLLTKLPEADIDDFVICEHDVGDKGSLTIKEMTRRELERVIRNYLRAFKGSKAIIKDAKDVDDDNSNIIKEACSIMEKLLKSLDNADLKCDKDTVNNLQRLCNKIVQKLSLEETM